MGKFHFIHPILIQKEVDIGPDDTVGSIYFNHLFPMGVDAMVHLGDVVDGTKRYHKEYKSSRSALYDLDYLEKVVINRQRVNSPPLTTGRDR